MKKIINFITGYNSEPFLWLAGLIFLYFINPTQTHFTFCPFKNLGINFCPGCGLGRSIHYLMHFQVQKSFECHPLGIFAFIILVHRVFTIFKTEFETNMRYL
jgi:Protein of unknown function (DUF2752)